MEQFGQSLHYLPFRLHILDALLYGKAILFKFYENYRIFQKSKFLEILRKVIQYFTTATIKIFNECKIHKWKCQMLESKNYQNSLKLLETMQFVFYCINCCFT